MNIYRLALRPLLGLLVLAAPQRVLAAPTVVAAGQTHTLHEDLVLDDDDVLEIRGTPEKPCTLVGNRHRIRTGAKWVGTLKVTHCTIRDLGGLPQRGADGLVSGPGVSALDLTVAGKGSVIVEHCTFSACAAIHLRTAGASIAAFCHNTVLDDSAVAISKDIGKSGDFFTATGTSKEPKLFQGNFIPRGKVVIRAPGWLVGGDRDADSNLFIGHRIGIVT